MKTRLLKRLRKKARRVYLVKKIRGVYYLIIRGFVIYGSRNLNKVIKICKRKRLELIIDEVEKLRQKSYFTFIDIRK